MLVAVLTIGVVVLVACTVAGTSLFVSKVVVPRQLTPANTQPPAPPLISRRVVVNLESGTAVAGVLVGYDEHRLTLKNAEVIEPGATAPTPADGEILVHRPHVDYIQAL